MKWIRAVFSLLLAGIVFWGLDNPHGMIPPAGKLFNPSAGFWQNGAHQDRLPNEVLIEGLHEDVEIVWDSRHVPHIFAKSDPDLYFAQGYVAALLRLWQMEFQVLYTSGRLSEIVGPAALEADRFQRRFGMVWAAENALSAFDGNPTSKESIGAYTKGVNAYIGGLRTKDLPLEYKVLDYVPEPWTDLKCALLLKSMSYILSGHNRDVAMTAMREALGEPVVDTLFPYDSPLASPVIPPGTALDFTPVRIPEPPLSLPPRRGFRRAANDRTTGPSPGARIVSVGPAPEIGSNNWAVSGGMTESGFPILCNDIHLALTLPAIWYEIQLSAPGVNTYGISIPGAPTVVAGFNERIAWGFTNGGSDVLDWYAVEFKDESRKEYLYDGEWIETSVREERIKVRGRPTVTDKVITTHIGPVVRISGEPPFAESDAPPDAALRWAAHDPSNEFLTLHLLNRGRSYEDYLHALGIWACPAQNIVYADVDGNIAMRHQGKFPLRWKGQGRYVLDASNPAHQWSGWIPRAQVPHVKNPDRGFVSSANQIYAGTDYPYYLGWDYVSFERGARINEILSTAKGVTPRDMILMQADVVNLRARLTLPRLLDLIRDVDKTDPERLSFEVLKDWNSESQAGAIAATIFDRFWSELNALTWDDEKGEGMDRMSWPASQVTIDLILNHPDSEFFDDRATPAVETLTEIILQAYRTAVRKLEKRWGTFGAAWEWGKVKGTSITHLAQIPGLGREALVTDGESCVLNAIDADWGPSWRMVVAMGPEVRAWGIYPGGQSGNPGSKHYDDFIDDWAKVRPYELVFLRSPEDDRPEVVRTMTLRGRK